LILRVSLHENTPDFRTLKYEYSLPDFLKLRRFIETDQSIKMAKLEDEKEAIQINAGKK
jgi:hypothetical protein